MGSSGKWGERRAGGRGYDGRGVNDFGLGSWVSVLLGGLVFSREVGIIDTFVMLLFYDYIRSA